MNNNNQTESYIILKPISERFNRIANDITDDEIKNLIKGEIRNEIQKCCDFGKSINEIGYEWIEDNKEVVIDLLKKTLVEKFR